MNELIAFFAIACLSAAVLLVSVVELFFTVRRRKAQEKLQAELKELKAAYNESVNQIVLENDSKLSEHEQTIDELSGAGETVADELKAEHAAELKALKEKSKKALEKAEEKARKLEEDAHKTADDYLEKRMKEVEGELMDLVVTVTKKVLPQGISYEAHRDLVARALQDVKASKES